MPKKFYESHQNMLKQLVIGNQLRYLNNNQGYLFDSSSTIIYPIKFQALLIYNMMKHLAIITESIFESQEHYIFMISNNYELLACSKNFEEEYFFNKKIFEAYDIKIMDIFQIKQDKLYKFFKKTFSPFIKNKYKIKEDHSINDNQSLKINMHKTHYFTKEKNNLIINKPRINSTKNSIFEKIKNKKLKSAIISPTNSARNIFSSNMVKHKLINTPITFRNDNKIFKRSCSAYYIKSDLPLQKQYITDLLFNDEKKGEYSSKISVIEQKINKLEKDLNIFSTKNSNTSHLSRCFSSAPNGRKTNPISNISFNYTKLCNSHRNKEENKTKEIILPDYLQESFNIEKTNILSPFCTKARDNYLLIKFFKYFNEKNNLKSDKKYINNKLNIIYAENEEIYNKKLIQLNKKLNKKGKKDKYHIGLSPCEEQLRNMEKKVSFMKNIIEYAYPNTVMIKLRIPESKKYFMKYNYKSDLKKNEFNDLAQKFVHIYKFPTKSKSLKK